MKTGQIVGGHYHLLEKLGRGQYGEVWCAEEQVAGHSLGRVAIKFLQEGADPKELALLSTLDHPHILRYRAAFLEDGILCLVTDFAEGQTLAEYARAWPRGAPVEEVSRLLLGVAQALAYMHGQQVIHRDVKPANILLKDGRAVLGDVGLAKVTVRSMTRNSGVGTMAYSAPEMWGDQVGPRSDVWAWGVTAFELLTGKPPFEALAREALMRQILEAEVNYPQQIGPTWRTLLDHCLMKLPGQRWLAQQVIDYFEEEGLVEGTTGALRKARAEIVRMEEALAKANGEVATSRREADAKVKALAEAKRAAEETAQGLRKAIAEKEREVAEARKVGEEKAQGLRKALEARQGDSLGARLLKGLAKLIRLLKWPVVLLAILSFAYCAYLPWHVYYSSPLDSLGAHQFPTDPNGARILSLFSLIAAFSFGLLLSCLLWFLQASDVARISMGALLLASGVPTFLAYVEWSDKLPLVQWGGFALFVAILVPIFAFFLFPLGMYFGLWLFARDSLPPAVSTSKM